MKNLTDHGLNLRRIRQCLHHLGNDSPLGPQLAESLKYLTDGKKLFVLTDDNKEILGALDHQFVFSLAIGALVRELSGEVERLETGKISPNRPSFMPVKRVLLTKRRG